MAEGWSECQAHEQVPCGWWFGDAPNTNLQTCMSWSLPQDPCCWWHAINGVSRRQWWSLLSIWSPAMREKVWLSNWQNKKEKSEEVRTDQTSTYKDQTFFQSSDVLLTQRLANRQILVEVKEDEVEKGWLHKSKGQFQVLWEHGWIDPTENIQNCEDSNVCGSQHSPEPTNNTKLIKLCRASTTRPICHDIFSQAKPTMTRPDVDNFHGLNNQDTRASTRYRPESSNQLVGMHSLASQIQAIFSLHILIGLELILQIYPSTLIIQHSLASQDPSKFQDIESCSAYLLTRFALLDWIQEPDFSFRLINNLAHNIQSLDLIKLQHITI